MKGSQWYLFCLLFLNPLLLKSQKIDNSASNEHIQSAGYFRFHYDNDFFTATDQYYTQGFNFELATPSIKKFPLSKLLLMHRNADTQYGLSIEHNAFSPSSIRHNEIILNDHPFAACIMLKTFATSLDTIQNVLLASVFTIGAIGPAAFGEEMQKSIHRWLKNIEPLGWAHQIHNDVIVNYKLSYEKLAFTFGKGLSFNTTGQVDMGTLYDHAKIGFNIKIGKFHSGFSSIRKINKNFQFYLYSQPVLRFIAYDATLQGGLFNKSSPYVLSANEISRFVLENKFGVVLTFKKLFLEYYQHIATREFKKGNFHRWGGIKIGFGF